MKITNIEIICNLFFRSWNFSFRIVIMWFRYFNFTTFYFFYKFHTVKPSISLCFTCFI